MMGRRLAMNLRLYSMCLWSISNFNLLFIIFKHRMLNNEFLYGKYLKLFAWIMLSIIDLVLSEGVFHFLFFISFVLYWIRAIFFKWQNTQNRTDNIVLI